MQIVADKVRNTADEWDGVALAFRLPQALISKARLYARVTFVDMGGGKVLVRPSTQTEIAQAALSDETFSEMA